MGCYDVRCEGWASRDIRSWEWVERVLIDVVAPFAVQSGERLKRLDRFNDVTDVRRS